MKMTVKVTHHRHFMEMIFTLKIQGLTSFMRFRDDYNTTKSDWDTLLSPEGGSLIFESSRGRVGIERGKGDDYVKFMHMTILAGEISLDIHINDCRKVIEEVRDSLQK